MADDKKDKKKKKKGKKGLNYAGIVLALVIGGGAWMYNTGSHKFKIKTKYIPMPTQIVHWEKKVKSGEKCYDIQVYKNIKGRRVTPGCVNKIYYKAICTAAKKCKKDN